MLSKYQDQNAKDNQINAPPIETQRESINNQIRKLQQRLDPLQATMNQEYAVMSNANNLKLSKQIQEIEQEITALQEQLKNLSPEQTSFVFEQGIRSQDPSISLQKAVESAEELTKKLLEVIYLLII